MTGAPGPLRIVACSACGWTSQGNRGFCPSCGGRALDTAEREITGTVYATTVVHRGVGDGPLGPPPFAIVLVTPDPPFANRIMAVAHEPLQIGARVSVGPLGPRAASPYLAINDGPTTTTG